tara:strand:+ start:89 stop:547 length:459 start_codon:yes stop_codon:yes gene_type:complete
MTEKIENTTPEFDALKGSYEGMSNILSKAEVGDSDPFKLAQDLNKVFVGYVGGDPKVHRMSSITEPYQQGLIKAVNSYNAALEEMKDTPRIFQNRGQILGGLEESVSELGGVFMRGSADTAVRELGIKPGKDELKGINANKLINVLVESYKK